MSTTVDRKASSTKPANHDPDRDGGPLQSRDAGDGTGPRKAKHDPDRDGGLIQSRGPNDDTTSAKEDAAQDDVERGA